MGRLAAALATEILEHHEARYGLDVGRVQIVIEDSRDDSNGFATPLPYPLVHVLAVAPDGSDDFGNLEAWLRVVLTHELAHIVHLDQSRGILHAGRKVFGRAPFLYPNALTPTWMIEGLATYEETQGTAFGRGRSTDSRMILRMAALEEDFPREDRPVYGLDRWPDGTAAYVFGEAFLRDLTSRFGEETLPDLARVHSGRVVPYLDDLTAHRVTGKSFHTLWREWAESSRDVFGAEAERIAARGLTRSRPLTMAGIRQSGPRFSPDGSWIAYTSQTLTRFRAIRLVRPDGTGDRKLVDRNGGGTLSWSPDGTTIVYDEPEIHSFFESRSDLRAVDVGTGRVRRLTRGLRAEYPDVAPDGKTIVFVHQLQDRAELAFISSNGGGLRDLTRSEPGTKWSEPSWSPSGDLIVASRWTHGGWLDLVQVDPTTGDQKKLTNDRARDLEPTFTPDGTHIVFRSDRDGVSNLYALRREDGALLRLTNLLGGAFMPSVSPDGKQVVFSNYSTRGYDVHLTSLDLDSAVVADPFLDTYPEPRADPAPVLSPAKDYNPFPVMLPRFWSPYLAFSTDEAQAGIATAGADPLLRHLYGGLVYRGTETRRNSVQAIYQYDRFWPTFLAVGQDTKSLADVTSSGQVFREISRTQEMLLQASFPVTRSYRQSESLFLAWRRRRESLESGPIAGPLAEFGGLELGWTLSNAKRYPYSISPVDGYTLTLAGVREDPAFGSNVSLYKLTATLRSYSRLLGEEGVLALRAGAGTTLGQRDFRRSFTVGGFPNGSLFDIVRSNSSVLRGYPDDAFVGRNYLQSSLEYRFPLGHPQHGLRSFPVFLRHLHGAVFFDAGHAWEGPTGSPQAFRVHDVKTSAGAALGSDLFLSHTFPLTVTLGIARGFASGGETQVYFRTGLSF